MEVVIIVVVCTLLLIGAIAYFVTSKMKKDSWEGELIDKREETSRIGDDDITNYVLTIKTTQGLDKEVRVRKKLYNEVAAGDKLIKLKGEAYPRKA